MLSDLIRIITSPHRMCGIALLGLCSMTAKDML